MKKNMSNTDRLIRLLVAAFVVALFFGDIITGTLGVVLMVVAVIFVLTSFISFCPLYSLFGINTCSSRKKKYEL